MKLNYSLITTLSALTMLASCGGGGSSSNSGAPSLSSLCSISNVSINKGTSASVSQANETLVATFVLNLTQALTIDVRSNFENINASDWIESRQLVQNLSAGSNSITVEYDMFSASLNQSDLYNKFNITTLLPGNEACVFNQAVNITLTP